MGTKVDINVTAYDGNTLIIREGKAPVLPQPQAKSLSGIITAPGAYAKTHVLKPEQAVVEVDYKKGTLELVDNLYHEFNTTVLGKILVDSRFTEFGINIATKKYDRDSLFKIFRMYPHLFKDGDVYNTILFELKNKTWKTSTEVNSTDNRKGDKSNSMQQVVVTPALSIEQFTLIIPLFEGDINMQIVVEIFTEFPNGSVQFTLESPGLQEIIDNRMRELLGREIEILRSAIETEGDGMTGKLCLIDVTGV